MHGDTPWLLMALLGAYHGINPGMGWLFAVSLGLQDRSRRSVIRALPPIALGHELGIVLVAALVIGLGVLVHSAPLHLGAAIALIAFGLFRFLKPHAHFRWTTMKVTRPELTLWSFLMSTAHGAGLMVAPVLIGLSGSSSAAAAQDHDLHEMKVGSMSVPETALAITLHVGAMLLVAGTVALLVYDRLGVKILRKAWVNLDLLWAAAFVFAGLLTLFSV
jgi:hypothetical protein